MKRLLRADSSKLNLLERVLRMIDFLENHQWRITRDGVEKITDGADNYLIEAERLLMTGGIGGHEFYDWPLHMAQKDWVDLDAFEAIFRYALVVHAGTYPGVVDQAKLSASFDEARRISAAGGERMSPIVVQPQERRLST